MIIRIIIVLKLIVCFVFSYPAPRPQPHPAPRRGAFKKHRDEHTVLTQSKDTPGHAAGFSRKDAGGGSPITSRSTRRFSTFDFFQSSQWRQGETFDSCCLPGLRCTTPRPLLLWQRHRPRPVAAPQESSPGAAPPAAHKVAASPPYAGIGSEAVS